VIVRLAAALAVSIFAVSCLFFVGLAGPTLFDRLTRTLNPMVVWAIYAAGIGAMVAYLVH
jgi:hypothetical protein